MEEWLVVNNTNQIIHLVANGIEGDVINVTSNFEKEVHVFNKKVFVDGALIKKLYFGAYSPCTVNACIIEDNRIRVNWTDGLGKYKNHPDEAETNKPKYTVVKVNTVNTNAIGTVIGRWWTDTYKEDDKRKLVELVDIFKTDLVTGIKSTYSQNVLEGRVHLNTQLHRDDIFGGHVLLPFASTQPDIFADKASYTPDTSHWSSYRFRIRPDGQGGPTSSPWVGNPTAHNRCATFLGVHERSVSRYHSRIRH
jgi:hypothetical protein